MFLRRLFLLSLLSASVKVFAQAPVDAGRLKVYWEVNENHYQNQAQFLSTFTIVNKNSKPFPVQGWKLYFNFVRSVTPGQLSGGVTVKHINGDLFEITPDERFKGIAPGDSLKIGLVADAWAVNFTDAPDGLFLVFNDGKTASLNDYTIRPSTEPKQYLRFPGDKSALITAADIYHQNEAITNVDAPAIFPTPQQITAGTGSLTLKATSIIDVAPTFEDEASYLAHELGKVFGQEPATSGGNAVIKLEADAGLPEEGYTLHVGTDGIVIKAARPAGMFYGIQSLKELLPANAWAGKQKEVSIPAVDVTDAPRYGYRAFMLDVARNFHSKEDVLRVLEVMSLYKLNVFHFHLTDDEGWRLEIPGLPELTAVGGHRGYSTDGRILQPAYGSGPDTTNAAGSGFFTRKDYIEILRYATVRHIRVIPEIETPGHARAAIKAMDVRYTQLMKQGNKAAAEKYLLTDLNDSSAYRSVQSWNDNVINVAVPSVYTFLDKVVTELQGMYTEAEAPLEYVHMGGDEVPAGVWQKSPAVHALMQQNTAVKDVNDLWYYYYGKVHDMLVSKGLKLYGWEEMGMRKTSIDGHPHNIPNPQFSNSEFMVDVWNNTMGGGSEDLPYRLANANYKVVLSVVSNNYFDMAYMKSFEEPGFYWGGFVDVDKPFYFIPENYYKNSKVDALGNPLSPDLLRGKDALTAYGAGNIVGLQGALWSETVKNRGRMEYMMLPKLLSLAERAWAPNPTWATEKDEAKSGQLYQQAWSVFTNTLGKHALPMLDYYNGGYQYRIPTPGALAENGTVKVNVQFPGMAVRYTSDGSEPTVKSPLVTNAITAKGTIKLKTFDTRGRSSRTVVVENK
jgi:hexosaminidase